MHGIEILLLFVVAAAAQERNSSQFPNWNSSWIEGGRDAAPGEFPFIVLLRIKKEGYCSGSIINTWYILTAAHCVTGVAEPQVKVVAGTNLFHSGGQWYDVARIVLHKGFFNRPPQTERDIALLKLTKPIVYGPTVQPIPLPNPDERIAIGRECIFSGWGSVTGSKVTIPDNLQTIQLPIIPNRVCKRFFDDFGPGMLCAGGVPGRTACEGDSGSPLICDNKLVGVYGGSKESVCGDEFPLIYTYVAKFAKWIMRHAV